MSTLTEIRWHGRGGQGAVTAAKVLAETCVSIGKHVQAFPEYGPERSGAPLKAYNRISDKPISLYCPVVHPGVVTVIDHTLLDAVDVTEDADDNATFVINSCTPPAQLRTKLKLKPTQKVFSVDATEIALQTIGRSIPNTPMLGALAKVTGMFTLEGLLEDMKKSFGKKFSDDIINKNLDAAKRGYEEVAG